MQHFLAFLLFGCAVCLFASALAKDKDDFCQATVECSDPGLVCTGARCKCIADVDPQQGKIWGCNNNEDCKTINALAAQGLTKEQQVASHAPVCTASVQCPSLSGLAGYCDVSLNA
ncbi:hypothetical protein RvY_04052 [Ramazzottius varieornatus]|uniref:EB domain-containing protein n=1 Tax=Ramazzottius varieornatus TaxID=947166 RepID=A0A1D1UX78_RAMVA|nr:hypothetical protein RvY_04052 [Ramazzottius varieornatus]